MIYSFITSPNLAVPTVLHMTRPTSAQAYSWAQLKINQKWLRQRLGAKQLHKWYISQCNFASLYTRNRWNGAGSIVSRLLYLQTAGPRINYTTVEIRYWLTLQRKPLFYIMNITIPAIVLAILSAMTFMVPIDSGERIGLGVSILLAFSVFMLILADNTPQTSQNPAILGKSFMMTSSDGRYFRIIGHLYGATADVLHNTRMVL